MRLTGDSGCSGDLPVPLDLLVVVVDLEEEEGIGSEVTVIMFIIITTKEDVIYNDSPAGDCWPSGGGGGGAARRPSWSGPRRTRTGCPRPTRQSRRGSGAASLKCRKDCLQKLDKD